MKRQFCEKRIYSGLDVSDLQYLFILFEQRRLNMGLEVEAMQQIIQKRNKNVMKQLNKEQLQIEKGHTIKGIRRQLQKSLSSSRPIASSQVKRLSKEQQQKKREQFRQKSYWKTPNQKTQEVQAFIKGMQQQQRSQRKRHRQKMKKERSRKKRSQESREVKKQEQQQQLKQQLHQQFKRKKEQNEREKQEVKKKQEQTEQFLKKFKEKPPNYIVYSQRYHKKQVEEEKQRKQFLKQLKQARRHNSLSEMREEMRKYNELKEMHSVERQEQRRLQAQITEEIRSKLRNLYRSRVFQRSLREQSAQSDPKLSKKKQILKMIMYSKKAQMQHVPKVSEQMKNQMLEGIIEKKKREDHSHIVKIRNGQQIVINKSRLDPRKIGLEYLQQLKQMTSQIERKPPPAPQIKEQKILDRSLLPTSFYNKKITITNWKQIMSNQSLTAEEKEEKLKVYFEMVEQKKMAGHYESKKADMQRSLQIQKMTDHYQVQKASAKLALLKSLK